MTNRRLWAAAPASDVFSFIELHIEISFVGIEHVHWGGYLWNGISMPAHARGSELFNVLNLFAHLLDQYFEVHGLACRFCIRRL